MSVVVYTKNICPACMKVKAFLEGNEVPYTVRNIEDTNVSPENPEKTMGEVYKQEVMALGVQAVPVVLIEGNEPVIGFNQPVLAEALGL
jgi:glutaredoxin